MPHAVMDTIRQASGALLESGYTIVLRGFVSSGRRSLAGATLSSRRHPDYGRAPASMVAACSSHSMVLVTTPEGGITR